MQTKSNKQTPAMTRGNFLISLTPEAILWHPVFEGVEIAVVSGDPNKAGSPFVIRAKHRDGVKVPPHWHSFDEPITVLSGTWVMGWAKNMIFLRQRSFQQGPFLLCRRKFLISPRAGETIVQGHGIGPLDTAFVRPDDDPPEKTK